MKLSLLVQLAALSTAFVIPNDQVFQELQVEAHHLTDSLLDRYEEAEHKVHDELNRAAHRLDDAFDTVRQKTEDAFDDVAAWTDEAAASVEDSLDSHYFAGKNWIESAVDNSKYCMKEDLTEGLAALGIRNYGRPHHGGHHHHHKPNQTVFQLIAKSKYTTKLAKLISEYDDLVKLLNGTSANFTVFAPTDRAFEKIPKHAPKPSKELLKKILTYHVSSDFYPAGRILTARTIPTLFEEKLLGKGNAQRLSTNIGFHGLTLNHYSRVVAADIFGTNGVIHGVDSILLLPPTALQIIDLLPSEFSTLSLGLAKTGLLDTLNSTKHKGATFFAPHNSAFSRLGPRINAFLFSKYGLKYLAALLKYHVVLDQTLYSDAFYEAKSADAVSVPKGHFHVDLPTLLDDRTLSIDIARWGRLIEIKINAFARVAVSDGVARDGVIHVLSDVLIPPKKLDGKHERVDGELSVEELCERLEPYVEPERDDL